MNRLPTINFQGIFVSFQGVCLKIVNHQPPLESWNTDRSYVCIYIYIHICIYYVLFGIRNDLGFTMKFQKDFLQAKLIPVGKWLITMVKKSPKDRVVPFPNDLMAIHGV